jgi:curved DNA-binding protein CbpA
MKPIGDMDHYEVLEVPRGTAGAELERAYQLAMATYADDSLAGYSIVDPGDAAVMRDRIEIAYRVLSDAQARRAYDVGIGLHAAPEPEPEAQAPAESAAVIEDPAPEQHLERIESVEAFETFGDEESGEYDGARLRRSRLRRGLSIEDVARVTKVKPGYLELLEAESFARLPARVYVRGFVMAYASCIGLDPKAVAVSYLERFDREPPRPRRRAGLPA